MLFHGGGAGDRLLQSGKLRHFLGISSESGDWLIPRDGPGEGAALYGTGPGS